MNNNLPNWISVNEKLPDNEERCITCSVHTHFDGSKTYLMFEDVYYSDISTAIRNDSCLEFIDDDPKPGFYYVEDDEEGGRYAYRDENDIICWMPGIVRIDQNQTTSN